MIETKPSGTLKTNVPLARHTTWRVGGPAQQLYLPHSLDDLKSFVTEHQSGPMIWLGLGSNSLIRDGGITGTVILTLRGLMELNQPDARIIRVQAGVPCAKVARLSAKMGLKGGEFLAGIPGTMGGALAMNAGCHGGETWDHVINVTTMDRQGQLHQRTPSDFTVGYRSVVGPEDEWFIGADLEFEIDAEQQALQRINHLLGLRAATQPTSEHNAGSVFRNPPGDHAARLIEAAGLKGFTIGGATVSTKHANFITSNESATAHDIETLISTVALEVFNQFGVMLHTEVKILGEPVIINSEH
jgi:UDP-N-acetylmuramate dehydrogenase